MEMTKKQNTTTTTTSEINRLELAETNDIEKQFQSDQEHDVVVAIDYSKRAQWLRAAVLGANDGLLSTASLMMGVGAVRTDVKTMILTGIAGLIAGACSMALGEFVSVYSQYDIEIAQMKRENNNDYNKNLNDNNNDGLRVSDEQWKEMKKGLPSPTKAAMASALAFAVGAAVPLLAAGFIKNYHVRLAAVVAAASMALIVFGGLGAYLGKAPFVKSCLRVLIGGLMAMGITFGLSKAVGHAGL